MRPALSIMKSGVVALSVIACSSRRCSCSACSTRFTSVMSVLVPNQRVMRPLSSLTGATRVRNGRNTPSLPRSGNTISNGCPLASEAFQRSTTAGSVSGSCTLSQPQPCICSSVVPVYSNQPRLYQPMLPSASAIHASCGIDSASVRNCASCCATSRRRRSSAASISASMARACAARVLCAMPDSSNPVAMKNTSANASPAAAMPSEPRGSIQR